ncbi:MAG: energy transducer TonB [Myxococcales bacterium]|nr:energy transducer TonB [Myxococcales bacterium]
MHTETASEESGEAALAFLLRPTGSPIHLDRSAGRALEVARIFGDEVVDIRYFSRTEIVRLGLADDFPVPVELLPGDHHAFLEHDGTAWVVRCWGAWAGFVDEEDRRTALVDRVARDGTMRLGEGETLVVEVGNSVFVVRTVWRSARLPVPLVGDIDPVGVLVAASVSAVAMMLGVLGAITPPPTHSSVEGEPVVTHIQLVLPLESEPTEAPSETKEKEAGGGSSVGPKDPKPSLDKRPGKPDAEVVRDDLDKLFGGLDAVLSETGLNADMKAGIDSLIASKGTQGLGPGGLGTGRCMGHDCKGFGTVDGSRIGDTPGSLRRPDAERLARLDTSITRDLARELVRVEEPILMGGIDRGQIDAVVKRHMNAIRYCYTRELTRTPQLTGKVSVKFIIAKDGSVSSATVAQSSMGSPAVEGCVTGRFMRMQFPEMQGGGIAVVKYPFVFAQG